MLYQKIDTDEAMTWELTDVTLSLMYPFYLIKWSMLQDT